MLEIIEAVDGKIALNQCLLRDGACQRSSWCAAHMVWREAQEAMLKVLARATVAELAERSKLKRKRPNRPFGVEIEWS